MARSLEPRLLTYCYAGWCQVVIHRSIAICYSHDLAARILRCPGVNNRVGRRCLLRALAVIGSGGVSENGSLSET